MNINELPDLCLRAIFTKLPLEDLIKAGQVCLLWKHLRQSECRKRRTVTLLLGRDPALLFAELKFHNYDTNSKFNHLKG